MPPKMLSSLAKKAGVALKTAERYWREAKKAVEEKEISPKDKWAYITGIVKRRLGLENVDLALTGWPANIVVEDTFSTDKNGEVCFYFNTSDVDVEKLQKDLGDEGEFVEVLKEANIGCVFSKDKSVSKTLSENKIQLISEKEVQCPALVSAILASVFEGARGEQSCLVEDGKVTFKKFLDEALLLEATAKGEAWLKLMFPNVDFSVISFHIGGQYK